MISHRAKYAMRALIALAQVEPDESVSIAELAVRQAIPKKFLEQILLDLKRHGIVHSRRGQQGGYSLLKDPSSITFGRILRIVDGPIALLPCLSKIAYRRCDDCVDESSCEIRRVFAEVAESSRQILDNTSLADAIAPRAARRGGKPAQRVRDAAAPAKVRARRPATAA
ncbi:MAG: Rrf2 family transcriptional regulator [Reyranellaceae bacterium]